MAEAIYFDRDRCLNGRYKEACCQQCRDLCPAHCINEALQIESKLCNHCGLCVAVCPVEAEAALNYSDRELMRLISAGLPAVFACQKQNKESSWPCLGFLESRLLVALAYGGNKLTVDNRACQQCNRPVHTHLITAINHANQVLAFCKKGLIQSGDDAEHSVYGKKVISRRSFFSAMLGAAVESIREAAFSEGGKLERLERKKWITGSLSDDLQSMPPQPLKGFFSMVVHDSCRACGLCAKICTGKAITIAEQTDLLTIYHESIQCSGCKICAAHCPVQAIEISAAVQLGKRKVIEANLPLCMTCGQSFQPVHNHSVCLDCMVAGRLQQ